ncbi:hypothetical protein D9O40_06710 [Clostridium autoethanogenum]|uniref:Uncharacterized protein n=1 Tax=Clostridium autoethanogenum TaxID=84023 RepID=A0A3M0SWU0_9CLOT|nr:hypothetical protein [Clostridium autoethanogenum]RMD02322.1 hypothetical protein D9O40_06710 [Clostridium autoethanogenum]
MEEMENESIEIEENDINIDDILENATQSKSKDITRTAGRSGILSIINAKTCTRLIFSNELLAKLGNPEGLQISYNEKNKTIIIGKSLGNENTYKLRRSGKKRVIYSKGLVRELTESLQLDFSQKTSITLQEANYLDNNEDIIAIIEV